ncbi:MAG: hypothetical protein JWM68_1552 [Verrucomicrobiales bacterium]|nr:hypothetical protein [Verrucomicrobiales bacterium]
MKQKPTLHTKIKSKLLKTAMVLLAAHTAVQADEKIAATVAAPAPTPAPTSAGLLNDFLREKHPAFSKWDIGGQVRARGEYKKYFAAAGVPGAVDFAATGDGDNAYFLLREKFHIGYTPSPWVTIYGEARDSSAQNDDRKPSPDSDTVDLYQAYVRVGNPKEFPLSLKIGRQELTYGDERLVGNGDWNNIPRSFDAAKMRFENDCFWVDAFTALPVLARDDRFNRANEHDILSGVYASTKKLLPKTETQFYFLSRNTSTDSATFLTKVLSGLVSPRDIYTVGGRVKSAPGEFGPWDFDAEAAYQFGRFKTGVATKSLEQQAMATHVAGGYTFAETFGKPRVGLEYNYASGDSSATDSKHETFDNLFPTNHKFYGYMDFVSLQNIHDLRFASSIKPCSKLTVTGDVHAFLLADNNDFFYSVSGAPRTTGGYGIKTAAGDYVGTEIDLVATYAIKPYAILQGGYGHFFKGEYVKNSLATTGGSKDADWVYTQMVFNF